MALKQILLSLNSTVNKNFIFKYAFISTKFPYAGFKPPVGDEEFRVLELYPYKQKEKRKSRLAYETQALAAREHRMPIDQHWPSVWPAPKSFRPSAVPLPVYQGFTKKKAPPGKYANAELMKIPNFLHLTPPAIKEHCAAIKKYCTKWPEGLETDEKCFQHFPLEVTTTDYCHSSPTIRDERARIVTFSFRLSSLNLDYHAKDKLLRLVGENRYNPDNGVVVIVADRCPVRKQNYDYLVYILTALYHESQVFEPWEAEKTEADMERFFFENSRVQNHFIETTNSIRVASGEEAIDKDALKQSEDVINFGNAVEELFNEEENSFTLDQYKRQVAKLMQLHIPEQTELSVDRVTV